MGSPSPATQSKIIICATCGDEFVFSPGEQRYYAQKGYTPPRHCASCRKTRRKFFAEISFGGYPSARPVR
jgi:hypothetical protein